jgi:hypothetical protein
MAVSDDKLWNLARSGQPIDAGELATALEEQATEDQPDFRTRLLMRDSLGALARHWGQERLEAWLTASPVGVRLWQAWQADLGEEGFPSLVRRIMDATKRETILQFFRELGTRLPTGARLYVGGSLVLILQGNLPRHTEDVNVVDGVPTEVRTQHDLLKELTVRYGLTLASTPSRFLPSGWHDRTHSLGRFGELEVALVDIYDVLTGKLFSAKMKDRDDLRGMSTRIDKQILAERLRHWPGPAPLEPRVTENARLNWYVVYGESLPQG